MGSDFCEVDKSKFGSCEYVIVEGELVYRVSEDEGVLRFVHLVTESEVGEISWRQMESVESPYMYAVSRDALGRVEGLERELMGKRPRYWWPNNENMRASIVNLVMGGETLLDVSKRKMYPPLKVIDGWRSRNEVFDKALSDAMMFTAQVMHDRALSEAQSASNMDPKATKALVEALKWSAQVWNPERFNPVKREESRTVIPQQVIIYTGVPSQQDAVIDVTPKESIDGLEG